MRNKGISKKSKKKQKYGVLGEKWSDIFRIIILLNVIPHQRKRRGVEGSALGTNSNGPATSFRPKAAPCSVSFRRANRAGWIESATICED